MTSDSFTVSCFFSDFDLCPTRWGNFKTQTLQEWMWFSNHRSELEISRSCALWTGHLKSVWKHLGLCSIWTFCPLDVSVVTVYLQNGLISLNLACTWQWWNAECVCFCVCACANPIGPNEGSPLALRCRPELFWSKCCTNVSLSLEKLLCLHLDQRTGWHLSPTVTVRECWFTI